MNVTFHGKRDFAGVIKVRLWIGKGYPEWPIVIPRTLIRGRQYGKRRGGNVGVLSSLSLEGSILEEVAPGRGHGNPLQYSCLENPPGQRSLLGYSMWGRKESDMTE